MEAVNAVFQNLSPLILLLIVVIAWKVREYREWNKISGGKK